MKVKLHILGLGLLGILVGCTGLSPDRYLFNKQSYMLSQGNPPAYVTGYIDGCSAGRRLAGDNRFVYRKNNTRFDKDALYARGWQEGQINCRNEALAEEIKSLRNSQRREESASKNPTVDEQRGKEDERAAEEEIRALWEELRK